MSGTDWDHAVTAALLGTDRRRLPEVAASSATTELLRLAARHRAASRAGVRLPWCAPVAVPAGDLRPEPPMGARVLLAHLMTTRQLELINSWLAAAIAHGVGVPGDQWTELIGLAARSTALDRDQLGEVLGVGGRWFVEQNPQWSGLARALRPRRSEPTESPPPGVGSEPADEQVSDEVRVARIAIAASFQAARHHPLSSGQERNRT